MISLDVETVLVGKGVTVVEGIEELERTIPPAEPKKEKEKEKERKGSHSTPLIYLTITANFRCNSAFSH